MRLVNVLQDLGFEPWGEAEIEHGRVGLIQLIVQFLRLLAELLRVTGHITDDNGIEDRAQRAKNESGGKL